MKNIVAVIVLAVVVSASLINSQTITYSTVPVQRQFFARTVQDSASVLLPALLPPPESIPHR